MFDCRGFGRGFWGLIMATKKKEVPKLDELDMADEAQREALSAAIKAAVAQFPCQLDVDAIVKHAMMVIRSEQTGALWSMLGLSRDWGEWKFDNCNGRKGAIENWVRDNCLDELGKFMQSELGEILEEKKTEFRKNIRANLVKAIDGRIKEREGVDYRIREQFENIQREMIKEVLEERKEEIRQQVLRSLTIDPAKYPQEKRHGW